MTDDDAAFREQLAYLRERSAFYREKLAGLSGEPGLADIAELPLTDKHELRATVTPENPIGAHLCADPSEIVRIYSTSGTTGAPSYIPLTARDLDQLMRLTDAFAEVNRRPIPKVPALRGRTVVAFRFRPGGRGGGHASSPGSVMVSMRLWTPRAASRCASFICGVIPAPIRRRFRSRHPAARW